MENKNYKKVNLTSSNLGAETLDKLRKIIPDVFLENKIDWDKLSAVLGYKVDDRVEKFGFTWAGKIEAIKNVLIPSKATLKPAKEEGVKFDESKNIFIEGDNLEVLKLLQRAYFEKIKMIYIDPPYNTGGDFVYKDNFAAPLKGYLEQTGQVDGDGNKLQANRETNGRYHSDWLSMMYPRLKLAWNLLRDDGVIFISIDDNEVHHLRMLMDEIFGEESFLATFIWKKKGTSTNVEGASVSSLTEYIIAYEKCGQSLNLRITPKEERNYPFEDELGKYRKTIIEKKNVGLYARSTMQFEIIGHKPREGKRWQIGEQTARDLEKGNRFIFEDETVKLKIYEFEDKDTYSANPNLFLNYGSTESAAKMVNNDIFDNGELFSNPKPVELIKKLIEISTKENDWVVDFFAGSGTTAQAALELNRKFVLVQLPEFLSVNNKDQKEAYNYCIKLSKPNNIAELTKERIRRVIKGYGDNPRPINDGFKVFKLDKSNYLENGFDFDPEKSEEENKKAFLAYLNKAKQDKLFEKTQEIDVVYENIIKEGLSLNAKIEEQKIAGIKIYRVADGEKQLLICLENKISLDAVKEFRKADYKGKIFICLDNALDDTAKANLALNMGLKTI